MSTEIIRLYRPSNGTEGYSFIERFCGECKHDDGGMGERLCEIIGATMVYEIDEPEYPTEWRYGEDGRPTCTKFERAASTLDGAKNG